MRMIWVASCVGLAALAACGNPSQPAENTSPAPDGMIAWSQVNPSDISFGGIHYAATQSGAAEISGVPANADPGGATGGVSIRIPDEIESQASGQHIRVTVRASAATPGATLGIAYSTNEVGNSNWRQFELTDQAADYTFEYDVPTKIQGNGDFLGFRSYADGRVRIEGYRVEVVGPSTAPAAAAAPEALRPTTEPTEATP